MKRLLLVLLLLLFARAAGAATCTVPFTFVNGTTADGGQVTSNFTSVLGCINSFGSAGLTISGGDLILQGANSGAVTIHPQANAGTYNWNLPVTAGTSGQLLQSGGGGIAPMTWTTTTFPATIAQNHLLYGSATNVISDAGPNLLWNPNTLTVTGTINATLAVNDNGTAPTGTLASGYVRATSPTLVTPVLGVATAISINKVTLTQPATGSTLTIVDGKTLTDTSAIGANVLLGAAGGGFTAYAGATCTNQVLTALSAAAAGTCSNITNAFLTAGSFTNITGVGTLTAGTWNATVITGTFGGMGVNNGSNTLTLGASWTLNGGGTLTGTAAQTYTLPTTTKTLMATDFSNVAAVKLGLANGGTNTDLSVTGAASNVLVQNSLGASLTVRQLSCADLSNAGSQCSGTASAKAVLMGFGGAVNMANNATNFTGLITNATEANVLLPVPFNATVKNLNVVISGLGGGGTSWTFTVRKGTAGSPLSDSVLACVNSGATLTCSDTVDSFTVNAGSVLTLKDVPAGTPVASFITGWSVELDPL